MTKRELKSLVRERDEVLTGTVAAVGVTRVTLDAATGEFVHTELDPEVCRQEMAAKHAAQVAKARKRLHLSTDDFAHMFGTTVRTVRNWERGIRVPSGAARVLIEVAARHPKAVLESVA